MLELGILLALVATAGFAIYSRRLRAKLLHSEARFQNVFRTHAIGFVLTDADGRIADANDYYLNLIQYSREDLRKGLNWRQFTPPEYVERSQNAIDELSQYGHAKPFEKEYIRRDGARIWVLVGATRIGEQVLNYVLDITDRKHARQDLEEIKERLETSVAQRTKELLGANRELYQLITERKQVDVQRTELVDARAARTAAENVAEKLTFLAKASAALNASLDIHSLLVSFAEVIVRNMADWCIIDFYNEKDQSVERMVATSSNGQIPDEFRNWWETKTLDLNAPEGLGYVIRTGEPKIYRNLDREHAAQYFSNPEHIEKIVEWGIHSSMVVPLNYHGRIFGALSFISTGEKCFDDFDLSMAQDLSKRAAMAIENARLYAKASEASRAKSAFLANISHEIRTPLGAMLGFAELVLEDRNLSPIQLDYVSTIARNGRQLLRIVDEVLDLSKVESNRIQVERLKFDLRDLFTEVRELLTVKSDEKGLTLSFGGIQSLPRQIISDPLRLRQILINVIGNAIKFTERGSIEVQTRFLPNSNQSIEGNLEIVVADTGVGISPNHSERLFQAFVQADESMTRKYGGTGLGLFLSRKLARLLGGDVELRKSELGKGSEFAITVKVECPDAVFAKPTSARDTDGPIAADRDYADARRMRILVADDSADNRMLIGALLAKAGVDIDFAETGEEAVHMALASEYDLVFMDIQMPEMDGFQAMKYLIERNYPTPVVALTAHSMKGDRERCLKAGFADYVGKPMTRQELVSCLARHSGGHLATAPLTMTPSYSQLH